MTGSRSREEELTRENSALRVEIAQMKEQVRGMNILRNLVETLQACNSREEAYPFIALAAGESFAASSGGLAVPLAGAPELLERAAEWGGEPWMKAEFAMEDCWALRRGTMHEPGRGIVCCHFEIEPGDAYVCVPLAVRGEIAGLLSLRLTKEQSLDEKGRAALSSFCNSVALGLSTLHLRETVCPVQPAGLKPRPV